MLRDRFDCHGDVFPVLAHISSFAGASSSNSGLIPSSASKGISGTLFLMIEARGIPGSPACCVMPRTLSATRLASLCLMERMIFLISGRTAGSR